VHDDGDVLRDAHGPDSSKVDSSTPHRILGGLHMTKPPPFDPMHLTDAMRESAQQIWLAGVGAFSKAQQEGGIESLLNVHGIEVGQKVLIKTGAFVGLEGLVSAVARDRVIVLMSLLGKDQTLKFDATDLSAA
ncbi:MAG: phasin family protein, partial [Burkholderiaceae bacterium]